MMLLNSKILDDTRTTSYSDFFYKGINLKKEISNFTYSFNYDDANLYQ